MPRKENQPEGLKKMTRDFNIFEKGDGPNSYDQQPRGDFKHLPTGVYYATDFGGPKTQTGGIGSPASARHTPGAVVNPMSKRDTRTLPERQEPGSLSLTSGMQEPERSGKQSQG